MYVLFFKKQKEVKSQFIKIKFFEFTLRENKS